MARKSGVEVQLEVLNREIKDLKNETKSLRSDINKGKGAIWILLILASFITGLYSYFK
jgi:hypothetical protein